MSIQPHFPRPWIVVDYTWCATCGIRATEPDHDLCTICDGVVLGYEVLELDDL